MEHASVGAPRSALRVCVRCLRELSEGAADRAESVLNPLVRPVVRRAQERLGGRSAEDLLARYRRGDSLSVARFGRVVWRNPPRRALIPLIERRVPKNVARVLRNGRFEVSYDVAFPDVVRNCAEVRGRATTGRPWLTPEIQQTYLRLHEMGHAHSVEVWREGKLVGGELGVSLGGYYSGESLFHLESDAGKVALAALAAHLHSRGFLLFDTQVLTPVVKQFGAHLVPRAEFRRRLVAALAAEATF